MLKNYRKKNNLSQEELAEEIGISSRHLQRLERNEEKKDSAHDHPAGRGRSSSDLLLSVEKL